MNDPFSFVVPSARGKVLLVLFLVTVSVAIPLGQIGRRLSKAGIVPYGMASFELATDAGRASEILAAWSAPADREAAQLSLGLDFLFLFLYPCTLSLAALLLSVAPAPAAPIMAPFGTSAAWLGLLALPFDLTENIALLHTLSHGAQESWTRLAFLSSSIKWGLIAFVFLYVIVAAVISLARIVLRRNPAI